MEEEWGPKCSLEGTLRTALVSEGTGLGGSYWEEGLGWMFPKEGEDPTCVDPRSSLGRFQGILVPERTGSDPPGQEYFSSTPGSPGGAALTYPRW